MEILKHFEKIVALPHCSYECEKLKEFLIKFAEQNGFFVELDAAGNILCKKGEPKICLQSHYDMVCVGDAPNIKMQIKDGFITALNSSLGADNGIGIAIMMEAMSKFSDLECLFTANEEVGLIGANNFGLKIHSNALLNLDSENVDEVIIGCAISSELKVKAKITYKNPSKKYLYKIHSKGYAGGHSGIDIVKEIPSALNDLALKLFECDAEIVEFGGGERSNSISVNASAVFYSDEELKSDENFEIERLEFCEKKVVANDIFTRLASYKHGVWAYSQELQIVKTSVNVAKVEQNGDEISICLYPRSDSRAALCELIAKTRAHFAGYSLSAGEFDEPWEPVANEFSHAVLKTLQNYNPKARLASIHAGLECGVLKKYKKNLLCASIGPNIFNPHSTSERCEIASIEIIKNTTFDLIKNYKGE